MKRQNLGKINSSNYQSLYLWTSFLLGMISLGFIIWQRRQTFSVIPAKSTIISNNSIVIPANAGIQLSPSKFLDSHLNGNDKFLTSIIFTPLILSALSFQQPESAMSGLLFGLGSYITQINAQVVPAITINLAELKQDEGVILTGSANTGFPVLAVDVNQDKKLDLLIGAHVSNKTYLVYGSTFNNTINLDRLSVDQGVIFVGGQFTGHGLYAADMNRDGAMDLLIGAFGANKVYLVYGPNFIQATNLDALNISQGITFIGDVSTGCDVFASNITGDGNIDLLIGAYGASKAYLVYGPNFANATNLSTLNSNQGLTFTGVYGTGYPVRAADMNNDGIMDLLIGALDSNTVYLVYGPNFTDITNLETLSGTQGVIFTGGANAGITITAADVNHDGFMDLLIGSRGANKVYLVYGPNFANASNLENLTAAQGVIFIASSGIGERNHVTDMNGDGIVDLLIGGRCCAVGNKTYLVYGPNFIDAANLDTLNLTQGAVFLAEGNGRAVDTGDFDGDGKLDIVIGSEGVNKVYIVYNHVFNIFPPLTTTVTTTLPTTLTSIATMQQQTETALTITSKEATSRNIVLTASTVSIEPILTTKLLPAENSNATDSMIGIGVGACVVGTLFGAVGFFAVNKCRKKKEKANNHSNARRDVSENNQNIDLGNNSARTTNSNQYQTAPVFDSRYNSARLQHQEQQPIAASVNSVQKNYRDIDETKKTEEQYENVPKLEI